MTKLRTLRCVLAQALLGAVIPMLWACHCPQPLPPIAAADRPTVMPTYGELVERYNANLAQVQSLRARAQVYLAWADDEGEHVETGEGTLLIGLPDRVTLTIGKAGVDGLWAGANEEQYWLLDLREKRAWFGRHELLTPARLARFPAPVHPRDLPMLLGLTSLPPADPFMVQPAVGWEQGLMVIQPPGQPVRLMLDPDTTQPRRIDLLDRLGRPRVTAQMGLPTPARGADASRGEPPMLPTRYDVRLTDRAGELSLTLSGARIDPELRDRLFDLDFLLDSAHRIPADQREDLDAP